MEVWKLEPHTFCGNLTQWTAKGHKNENVLCTSISKLPPFLRVATLSNWHSYLCGPRAGRDTQRPISDVTWEDQEVFSFAELACQPQGFSEAVL